MATRQKMAKVHSILTLHERGWSRRRIARELGIDRATVGRYVRLAESPPNPPAGPSGGGNAGAGIQTQPNPPPGSGERTPPNPPAGSPFGTASRCGPFRDQNPVRAIAG